MMPTRNKTYNYASPGQLGCANDGSGVIRKFAHIIVENIKDPLAFCDE